MENHTQRIKAGKNAIIRARLCCRRFAANGVRLQLHALAYNLAKCLRTLTLPEAGRNHGPGRLVPAHPRRLGGVAPVAATTRRAASRRRPRERNTRRNGEHMAD